MSNLKLPKHISGCGQYGKGFLAGMEYQRKKPWIDINDQLPEDGDLVIARFEGVYSHRLVVFVSGHFGRIDEIDGKGSQPATHWIPVPTNET